ncbi:MAG: HEAT repeat domain-containing protein, partial [Candidatus Hodarchaeales archaeon]
IPELQKLLKNPKADIRRQAINVLGEMKNLNISSLIIPILIKQYEENPDDRSICIYALNKVGYYGKHENAVLSLFQEVFDHEEKDVRHQVVFALGLNTSTKGILLLKKALNDPNQDIRKSSIYELELISAQLGYKDYLELLRDSRYITDQGRLKRAIEEYIQDLDSVFLQKRQIASYKLGVIKAKEGILALESKLNKRKENVLVRAFSAWSLGEIGDKRAVKTLNAIRRQKEIVMDSIDIALLKINSYGNFLPDEVERIKENTDKLFKKFNKIKYEEQPKNWWYKIPETIRNLVIMAVGTIIGIIIKWVFE